MNEQFALFLDVTWPAFGLLGFVIFWAWFLLRDSKPPRHLPPAE